jgi:prepilin peptidase CpaA
MHSIAWWPTFVLVVLAAVSDLRSRRIPNWLVVPFLLAGVITLTVKYGAHGLAQSLEGLMLGAILLGVLCWLGGMGMGDVKLCAAIGAWVGPGQLMLALVLMGIAGGVMAVIWALRGGFLKESLTGTGELVFGSWKRGFRAHEKLVLSNPEARKMPYAPAIAIGTILSFLALP